MALQILRYIHAPHITLDDLEDVLSMKLSHIQGDVFQEVEAYFHERLLQELAKRVKEFRNLSGVGLFSLATGSRVPSTPGTGQIQQLRQQDLKAAARLRREARDEGGIEDMATRLAHIGMLHWRVWGHIAYIPDNSISSYPAS
jgi:hypothetical protein